MERINDCDVFINSLTSAIAAIVSAEIPKLNEVWNDLWDREQRQQRFVSLKSDILSRVGAIFNEALCPDTQTKEECIEKTKQDEISKLTKLAIKLKEKSEKHRQIYEERMRLLKELTEKEAELAETLGALPVAPTEAHLDRLAKQVSTLEAEKKSRMAVFVRKRQQILDLFRKLAIKLNEKSEKHRQIYEERMRLLKELTEKEAELAETLGALPVACDLPSIPTEADLDRLAKQVSTLEAEKKSRMAVFVRKRQQILDLFRKLGINPSLNFERSIASEDILKTFQVTSENMDKVDYLLGRVQKDMKSAEDKRSYLVGTLRRMWSYLEEPEDRQELFLSAYSGYTPKDFAAIQAELERCRKEKSANIEKFVIRIREDLVVEWDRCMVSQATRDRFHIFRVDYYNEDIYDLHELELVRWQNFYKDNQDIFDLYRKHTELFEKLLELNGRGKSADRYQNRGGQLLLEERQRKLVAKELPRVDKDLQAALERFEEARRTRTPLAAKRPAQPSTSSAKIRRMAPLSEKKAVRRANEEPDSTMNIEQSYEIFQKTFKSKLGANKLVGHSTEFLTPSREATKNPRNLAVTPRTETSTSPRGPNTDSNTSGSN